MAATGLANAKIAEVMGISTRTVRNHIDHVLTKLGVHSKLEAVVYAARHRIVERRGATTASRSRR